MAQETHITVRPLNPRLIYSLRQASKPIKDVQLVPLYENPDHLRGDIRVLSRKGMVAETRMGLVWAGT